MVLVADDEEREQGDLIVAAELIAEEQVHARLHPYLPASTDTTGYVTIDCLPVLTQFLTRCGAGGIHGEAAQARLLPDGRGVRSPQTSVDGQQNELFLGQILHNGGRRAGRGCRALSALQACKTRAADLAAPNPQESLLASPPTIAP